MSWSTLHKAIEGIEGDIEEGKTPEYQKDGTVKISQPLYSCWYNVRLPVEIEKMIRVKSKAKNITDQKFIEALIIDTLYDQVVDKMLLEGE